MEIETQAGISAFDVYVDLLRKSQELEHDLATTVTAPDVAEAYSDAIGILSGKILEQEMAPGFDEELIAAGADAEQALTQLDKLASILPEDALAAKKAPYLTRLAAAGHFLATRELATSSDTGAARVIRAAQNAGAITLPEVVTSPAAASGGTLPTAPRPSRPAELTKPEAAEELSLADRHFDNRSASVVVAFLRVCRDALRDLGLAAPTEELLQQFLRDDETPPTLLKGKQLQTERGAALDSVFSLLNNHDLLLAVIDDLDTDDPRCNLLAYLLENGATEKGDDLRELVDTNRTLIVTYDLPKRGGMEIHGVRTEYDSLEGDNAAHASDRGHAGELTETIEPETANPFLILAEGTPEFRVWERLNETVRPLLAELSMMYPSWGSAQKMSIADMTPYFYSTPPGKHVATARDKMIGLLKPHSRHKVMRGDFVSLETALYARALKIAPVEALCRREVGRDFTKAAISEICRQHFPDYRSAVEDEAAENEGRDEAETATPAAGGTN